MKTLKSKLKLFLTSISIIGLATFFVVSAGYAAGTVVSYESGYYNSGFNDHRSYGNNYDGTSARNDTTYWQALGNSAYQNNYGVSWSASDDGLNWSAYGNDDLYVGQQVKFQFNMYSEDKGTHLANILKSWIDWGVGATETPSFDTVLYSDAKLVAETDNRSTETFTSDAILLDDTYLGTAYLRARVTCTESILNTNSDQFTDTYWSWYYYQWLPEDQFHYSTAQYESAFDAYSDYWQGEIEDWKFNVNKRPGGGDAVPEPATFALFGMGLIGLARLGRKKV